jgi:phage RecT family recombinase
MSNTTNDQQGVAVIKPALFEPISKRFTEMANEQEFKREVSFACQILAKNDYLAKSAPHTIQAAVLNVAQIGLSLNPVLKLAYLVPRWNRGANCVECYLEPSYQGLVKLMTDTRSVVNIAAQLIWEGDDVDLDMASREKVKSHKPHVLTGRDKGRLMGVYSLATLHDGSREVEVMSAKDVYEIRERSESYKKAKEKPGMTSVWITDEGEMFRKTVIRRHFKYLPKSDAFERVAEAVKLDETDYVHSHAQWQLIIRLLHTAEIADEKRQQIEDEMHKYTSIEASMCIEYLQLNQPKDYVKELGQQARELAAKKP